MLIHETVSRTFPFIVQFKEKVCSQFLQPKLVGDGIVYLPFCHEMTDPKLPKGERCQVLPHGEGDQGKVPASHQPGPMFAYRTIVLFVNRTIDAVLVSFHHLDTKEGHLGRGNIS